VRYFLWQFGHMHTMHFETNSTHEIFCPICGDTYENRKIMTTNTTNTTNKTTLPAAPKQEVSRFAQWSFYLIFFALGNLSIALVCLAVGITIGVVSVLTIAAFALLTSISLGILSLRERN